MEEKTLSLEEKNALKAAYTLREYCFVQGVCAKCLFRGRRDVCKINTGDVPEDWTLPKFRATKPVYDPPEKQKPPTAPEIENDNVNHPGHYTAGGVECIDAIEAATVNLTGIEAVCTGNVIKYSWRWKLKNGVEDLKKAAWYLHKLIKKLDPTWRAGE